MSASRERDSQLRVDAGHLDSLPRGRIPVNPSLERKELLEQKLSPKYLMAKLRIPRWLFLSHEQWAFSVTP